MPLCLRDAKQSTVSFELQKVYKKSETADCL